MQQSDSFPVSRNTLETMRDAARVVANFVDLMEVFVAEGRHAEWEDATTKSWAIAEQLEQLCQR